MTITVYYWGPNEKVNTYGRAIGIYAALNQAGVDYETKTTQEIPRGFPSFATPCIDLDGLKLGQTATILMALGTKFDLAGDTPEESHRVSQLLHDWTDVRDEHYRFVDHPERGHAWFNYLEGRLQEGGTTWVAGTQEATVADFHGVYVCECLSARGIDFKQGYPSLARWWDEIKTVPGVKKLYDGCEEHEGRTMIPF
jgi:glutathione S-transferase